MSDGVMNASLKWFDQVKGYGFLVVEGLDKDVFLHVKRLRESGIQGFLADGERITCKINEGPRGPYATDLTRGGHDAGSPTPHKV